jgi:hypothetical protein
MHSHKSARGSGTALRREHGEPALRTPSRDRFVSSTARQYSLCVIFAHVSSHWFGGRGSLGSADSEHTCARLDDSDYLRVCIRGLHRAGLEKRDQIGAPSFARNVDRVMLRLHGCRSCTKRARVLTRALTEFLMRGSAPHDRSSCTRSAWPCHVASCSGVHPFWARGASHSKRRPEEGAGWPSAHALVRQSTSPSSRFLRRYASTPKLPARAATCSGHQLSCVVAPRSSAAPRGRAIASRNDSGYVQRREAVFHQVPHSAKLTRRTREETWPVFRWARTAPCWTARSRWRAGSVEKGRGPSTSSARDSSLAYTVPPWRCAASDLLARPPRMALLGSRGRTFRRRTRGHRAAHRALRPAVRGGRARVQAHAQTAPSATTPQ